MTYSMIMRNHAQSVVCASAILGLTSRTDAPVLLSLIAEHVALTPANTALCREADLEAAEGELLELNAVLAAEEASFDALARAFVRTVTLPSGSIGHAVNRECFGDMAMTDVLIGRREQKLMRFQLYITNLGRRKDVSFDPAGLAELREALDRLQSADCAAYAAGTRAAELRSSRRDAFLAFESDYARFANAARALWGREALRQWLPVFRRQEPEERADDSFTVEAPSVMDNDDVAADSNSPEVESPVP